MSWQCDFKCDYKFFSVITSSIKAENCWFQNEAKRNWYKLSYDKTFRGFWENGRFLKIFLSIYLEKLTHLFQSFKKCFSYLIAWWFGDGYKWRVDWLHMFRIGKNEGLFALISHVSFIFATFPISLIIKCH